MLVNLRAAAEREQQHRTFFENADCFLSTPLIQPVEYVTDGTMIQTTAFVKVLKNLKSF
jgi:hypothetical protein